MAINMQNIASLLSEFSQAFYSDDFQSLFSLDELIRISIHSHPEYESLLQSNIEYKKFREDAILFEESLSYLRAPGWVLESEASDIKVESLCSGADFYTRASVLINANMFETLSVISELELLPNWIHALSQVNVLASPAKFKRLTKYHFWFPWPLVNRECILEFSAYPVMESQSMLITMKSPTDSYLSDPIPPPSGDNERMKVSFGCIFIQFISPEITKVSILVQASASLIPCSMLPGWLLSFGKKQIMFYLMDALRQTVLQFHGSEYETRVEANPDFYSFLSSVIATYINPA